MASMLGDELDRVVMLVRSFFFLSVCYHSIISHSPSHSSDFPYSQCVSYLSLRIFSLAQAIFHTSIFCLFNLMRYASFFILHLKSIFQSFIFINITMQRERTQTISIGSIGYDMLASKATACIFNFPYCHSYIFAHIQMQEKISD